MYLAAIVAADLVVTEFGPSASVYSAFAFIGLDLIARDRLHDLWATNLLPNMAVMILAGSALGYLLNGDAARVAVASGCAFAAATSVDYLLYHVLKARGWRWIERANGSNIPAAAVDSVVFPLMAFGPPLLWPIVFGQFCAKVGGGVVWSLVLQGRKERELVVTGG